MEVVETAAGGDGGGFNLRLVKMDLVEDLERWWKASITPGTGFEDVFLINFRQMGWFIKLLSKSFS